MIHTSRQLKALVRNISKGDSNKAQIIIRKYAMERFLERLSLSRLRESLILKGGIMVAAMAGLDNRSTMDIDATIKNLQLDEDSVQNIVDEITDIYIDDGITFEIRSVTPIMDESDYPGIRAVLDTALDGMHTPLKIDFSTGDVITPHEVKFSFKLMFEDRAIPVLAYNLETILAEKLETIIARGTANSRMRDFYDIHILSDSQMYNYSIETLKEAFLNTCKKRGSISLINDIDIILDEISESKELAVLWLKYQQKFDYADKVTWEAVIQSVKRLAYICIGK